MAEIYRKNRVLQVLFRKHITVAYGYRYLPYSLLTAVFEFFSFFIFFLYMMPCTGIMCTDKQEEGGGGVIIVNSLTVF